MCVLARVCMLGTLADDKIYVRITDDNRTTVFDDTYLRLKFGGVKVAYFRFTCPTSSITYT